MLLQFTVLGFRSFREKAQLRLGTTERGGPRGFGVQYGGDRLLRAVIILGGSDVVAAFDVARRLALGEPMPLSATAEFEFELLLGGGLYRYSLTAGPRGPETESLRLEQHTLFDCRAIPEGAAPMVATSRDEPLRELREWFRTSLDTTRVHGSVPLELSQTAFVESRVTVVDDIGRSPHVTPAFLSQFLSALTPAQLIVATNDGSLIAPDLLLPAAVWRVTEDSTGARALQASQVLTPGEELRASLATASSTSEGIGPFINQLQAFCREDGGRAALGEWVQGGGLAQFERDPVLFSSLLTAASFADVPGLEAVLAQLFERDDVNEYVLATASECLSRLTVRSEEMRARLWAALRARIERVVAAGKPGPLIVGLVAAPRLGRTEALPWLLEVLGGRSSYYAKGAAIALKSGFSEPADSAWDRLSDPERSAVMSVLQERLRKEPAIRTELLWALGSVSTEATLPVVAGLIAEAFTRWTTRDRITVVRTGRELLQHWGSSAREAFQRAFSETSAGDWEAFQRALGE